MNLARVCEELREFADSEVDIQSCGECDILQGADESPIVVTVHVVHFSRHCRILVFGGNRARSERGSDC